MFKKYQHVERFGTTEVDGIEIGVCNVFPKIDGTNASVWLSNNDEIRAGSRNRELCLEKDNAGFYEWVLKQTNIYNFLLSRPYLRLYGEWLVPHSLKTYEDNAWREFYVFDVVYDVSDEEIKYLPYEEYKPLLETYGINYIPPLATIKNGKADQFYNLLEKNVFLLQDGNGSGEGIVIKNYDFQNKYGRTTWAKIVTNEFKQKHAKEMGCPEIQGGLSVEEKIVEEFLTKSLIQKEHAKIVNECDGWQSKFIPRLLNTCFYELVKEETWNFIKKHKNPKIDFKLLMRFCNQRTKEVMPDLF